MLTRLLLIFALVLGQLSAGAMIAASASISIAAHDDDNCCGGNCCCPPRMCMCSAPAPDDQPAQPAPTRSASSREQLTLAPSPIIAIISTGDADIARRMASHGAIDIAALRAPERLARLCVWLT